MGWVFLASNKELSEILVMWDKRVVNLLEESIGE